MEIFYDIVYMEKREDVEHTLTYDTLTEARNDFQKMVDSGDLKYAYLNEVSTDYIDQEDIEVLDSYVDE